MNKTIRTRFAPSPTGLMHIGGVRTALFNYLFAKQARGQFLLRLEDTDRERFVDSSVEQIVQSLDWLGMKPDEGFWISEGKHQNVNFVQSERHGRGFYQKFADQLLEQGLAYRSYIEADKYKEKKQEHIKQNKPFVYRKSYEAEHHDDKAEPKQGDYPVRLDIEAVRRKYPLVKWQDTIRGEFEEDLDNIEDFIIIKSDGFPTYNFANVIDDNDMNITHVIRGDEFIASAGKHALLYDLFEWESPQFVHLPVINGTDGKKLSKRTGDTDVLEYRAKGYLPEALLNFLALLGWNDGTEQEIYGVNELIDKFKLAQLNTSPAVFDPQRLNWISGHHVRAMPLDELYSRIDQESTRRKTSFWPETAKDYSDEYKKQVLALVQERMKFFEELAELTRFFFEDLPVDPSLISGHKKLKQLGGSELKTMLGQVKDKLQKSDFSEEDLTTRLNQLLEDTGKKPVVLFSLVRIATTQAPASPPLAPSLHVLGKEKVLKRIDTQIAQL